MALSALFTVFFTVSNAILIAFHVFLNLKKLTTYEFIVNRRKRTSKVAGNDELSKYYEPYIDASRSESVELVRAPNLLNNKQKS